jgi:hypothetical protein
VGVNLSDVELAKHTRTDVQYIELQSRWDFPGYTTRCVSRVGQVGS